MTRPTSEHTKETWRLFDVQQLPEVKVDLRVQLQGLDPSIIHLTHTAE